MSKPLLCMNTEVLSPLPYEEQIRLIGEAGFDAFFTSWKQGCPIEKWRKAANEAGLIYQSVHAPIGGAAIMWQDDEAEAKTAENELIDCVRSCSENEVPIMISHVYVGFEKHPPVSSRGIERYARVVREAEKCGVKIAFENTEGEEFLAAVLNAFADSKNVGFCIDTGHAMCYNPNVDLFSLYGDKIIATHLNDNLGVRDKNGTISRFDDLHLLPFDGIADWDKITGELKKHGFNGILTFELKVHSKSNRHENDRYIQMPYVQYLAECYMRACRVAAKMSDDGFLY